MDSHIRLYVKNLARAHKAEKHNPEGKTHDVLSIQRGNSNESYKMLGKSDISDDTKKEAERGHVTFLASAYGCRGACTSKNGKRRAAALIEAKRQKQNKTTKKNT